MLWLGSDHGNNDDFTLHDDDQNELDEQHATKYETKHGNDEQNRRDSKDNNA